MRVHTVITHLWLFYQYLLLFAEHEESSSNEGDGVGSFGGAGHCPHHPGPGDGGIVLTALHPAFNTP